jgi:hypothetical protein
MEAYFNELSCYPLCTSKENAKERAYKFASLLAATQENGFNIVRCPDKGIADILLCKDYTVADLCNENIRGSKEILLLSMLRPPYFESDSEEEKAYIEGVFSIAVSNDDTIEKENKKAYGLSAACLKKSIGHNFCSCQFWEKEKEYIVIEDRENNKSTHKVLSFSVPEDFYSTNYMQWQVETQPRNFSDCGIDPQKKSCSLSSDHHGNKELKAFAKDSLFPLPYIKEVVTSIGYTPHCKTFVKNLQVKTRRIEVVLKWTEKGFGLVVQTTAQNELELRQIADELEKRFGSRS